MNLGEEIQIHEIVPEIIPEAVPDYEEENFEHGEQHELEEVPNEEQPVKVGVGQ